MKDMKCLRCGAPMEYAKRTKIQLGEAGWVLNDLPHLIHGAMDVDIYACPDCGKLEFFHADPEEENMPQKRCPKCGKMHDVDWPKCPFCKHDYYGK